MSRRVIVVLGLAGALLVTGPALAAPTVAPVIEPTGPFLGSSWIYEYDPLPPARRIAWSPIAFTGCGSYEVEITNRTTGALTVIEVFPAVDRTAPVSILELPPTTLRVGPAPDVPRDATNHAELSNGHRYAFRVRGVERTPGPSPGPWLPLPQCRSTGVGPSEPGPWSGQSADVRVDAADPVIRADINGGREFTHRRAATLHIGTLADPEPAGLPGSVSGIAGITVNGAPVRAGTMRVPLVLSAGDGLKEVEYAARDGVGHETSHMDSIVLDTRPPVVRLRRAVVTAPVGAVVPYSAAATDPGPRDAASGVRRDGYRWRFGDGLVGGITATPSHVFRRAGVYCGLATARDRAGNVGRARVVSRIGPARRRPVLGRLRVVGRTRDGRRVRVEACLGARATLRVTVTDAGGRRRSRVVRGPGVTELTPRARPGRVRVRVEGGRDAREVTIRGGTRRR